MVIDGTRHWSNPFLRNIKVKGRQSPEEYFSVIFAAILFKYQMLQKRMLGFTVLSVIHHYLVWLILFVEFNKIASTCIWDQGRSQKGGTIMFRIENAHFNPIRPLLCQINARQLKRNTILEWFNA